MLCGQPAGEQQRVAQGSGDLLHGDRPVRQDDPAAGVRRFDRRQHHQAQELPLGDHGGRNEQMQRAGMEQSTRGGNADRSRLRRSDQRTHAKDHGDVTDV